MASVTQRMDGTGRTPAALRSGRGWWRSLAPWGFLAPYLAVFLIFFLLPGLWSAVMSLTDWKIVGTPRLVGFKNYLRLLTDPLFYTALKNTIVYTAAAA